MNRERLRSAGRPGGCRGGSTAGQRPQVPILLAFRVYVWGPFQPEALRACPGKPARGDLQWGVGPFGGRTLTGIGQADKNKLPIMDLTGSFFLSACLTKDHARTRIPNAKGTRECQTR